MAHATKQQYALTTRILVCALCSEKFKATSWNEHVLSGDGKSYICTVCGGKTPYHKVESESQL